jgi:hypothetical protein
MDQTLLYHKAQATTSVKDSLSGHGSSLDGCIRISIMLALHEVNIDNFWLDAEASLTTTLTDRARLGIRRRLVFISGECKAW